MSLLNRTNNQAALEAAVTTLQSRSLTQLAIARFLRNRVAVGASIVLLILVALAVFAPVFELLTGYPMEFQDRDFYSGKPPNWEAQHYLGTDYNGRDILVRTMFGMRISMMVALVAATVALVIGISYGAISGLAGGMVDTIMMRILDLLYSFPLTLIAVIALAYFGRNIMIVFVIIGLVEWQLIARVIPVSHRGRFFGLSFLVGSLLGVLGAALSGEILRRFPYSTNYGLSFTLAFLGVTLSFVSLALNREPEPPEKPPRPCVQPRFWRRFGTILKGNPNFRIFLFTRILAYSGSMAYGFVAVSGINCLSQ